MQDGVVSVAVVDADRARATIVEEGLRAAGIPRVAIVPDSPDLLDRLVTLAPDVVVIALDSPNRDVLEQMFRVSRIVERPVAMFVDRSDAATMQAAIDAGVSAYVVDGLKPERVRAIVDMAVMRFNAYSRMRRELEEAKTALADRKTIDKAKGLLMARKGLSEQDAYALLRRTAMNEKKRMVEIAQAIITAAELF
ncbi:ANTAR domain-containing protein [Rhodoplanes sp. TEM]|uniref:ANTAR domain-containing protein n=1 Tax=Rhodoplanes tepidamans TaxID=200616 RepID=A0ABT5J5D5_RHOTP|nr:MULTISPECIES: ANTAR domain-containing protein [Rhodoplanes]MDC7784840.1 ANTAR domain-containing protein [Rhodoplanes tepidamans]MDC7982307.1 ANTAR domain-containing protein [Rhodoplanes sp. TEM]MDQ0356316.1 response regulator NasT [Rhodoplanes tepidamans]